MMYRGFKIEKLDDSTYQVGAYHYNSCKALQEDIDRHISKRIDILQADIERLLDSRIPSSFNRKQKQRRFDNVMAQIETIKSKIKELQEA
jgi:anti-sigma factor ChrR (cupin superfamily)